MKGKVMFRDKKKTQRWLRALEIAKVIFWHERYHTKYLEELEDFVRRKRMYSPRIKEEHIPKLYQLAKSKKMAMTKLVNKIISDYLTKEAKASAAVHENQKQWD